MNAIRAKLVPLAATSAFALAGCDELPQDGPKSFVGDDERRSYASDRKVDAASQERALAERARTQDEYLMMGNGGK